MIMGLTLRPSAASLTALMLRGVRPHYPELCVWIELTIAANEPHSKPRPLRLLEPRLHWQVRIAYLRAASLSTLRFSKELSFHKFSIHSLSLIHI